MINEIATTKINEQDIYGDDIVINVIGKSVPLDRDYRETYGTMIDSSQHKFEIIELSINGEEYNMHDLASIIGCHIDYIKETIQLSLHNSDMTI